MRCAVIFMDAASHRASSKGIDDPPLPAFFVFFAVAFFAYFSAFTVFCFRRLLRHAISPCT
jgi:hypothetical protein